MSNQRLSLVQTFAAAFRSQIPDAEKVNTFRGFDFTARFKLYPQTEETRDHLAKLQREKGNVGFLDEVLVSATAPPNIELVDENDAEISPEQFVKHHLIVQQDCVLAFWDVVNKGVEEKNSKRSRGR